VRSGAKPSRALCRGWRPHRSRIERAAATARATGEVQGKSSSTIASLERVHNFGVMARMLLNGESKFLVLCAINGLGVAEKSLVTTLARGNG